MSITMMMMMGRNRRKREKESEQRAVVESSGMRASEQKSEVMANPFRATGWLVFLMFSCFLMFPFDPLIDIDSAGREEIQ